MAQVYKFGGASVKNAEGVRNVEKIVRMAEGDLMVVVSAMGKTTNFLEKLLDAFFPFIDPLSVNRQGHDEGIQYRTGIFYTDESQLPAAWPKRVHSDPPSCHA